MTLAGGAWPTIPDVGSKTLKEAALWLVMWSVAERIAEVGGNNRGPWPDYYAQAVGLDPAGAFPWCTDGMYCCFREAARQKGLTNPFPKTAKAVSVWTLTEPICRIVNPILGAVGVLDHGKKWASELGSGERLTDNGHIVIACADGASDASGNTNSAGSREGNCWAVKTWPDGGDPAAVHGGIVIGWLDLDLAAQSPFAAA